MSPVQTLHDFAQTLLSDPQALAAFDADPQSALSAAGLEDVTAADVHEILPMVTENAPASLAGATDSFGAANDVARSLDSAPLPDLSGVFGAVSDVASATGLNTVTDGVLNTASDVVDNVAGATAGVPVVGPLADAAATDLQHTVAGVGEHLYDGKLVGAAVDGVTNHLGDSLLASTTVDTVSGLPGVGGPAGELVDGVRHAGADVLGDVNDAVGSTPIGDPNARLLSGDFGSAGDTFDTLDHATAAAPAVPAVPAAPALPDVPAVDEVAAPVTDTVGDVAPEVPVAAPDLEDVPGSLADAGSLQAPAEVADVGSQVGTLANGVDDHVQDLGGGVLDGGVNLPATDHLPGTDQLPGTDALDIGL